MMRIAPAALLLAACGATAPPDAVVTRPPLECRGVFSPTTSQQALATELGEANVREERIDVGEGQFLPGTLLFPGTASALEVVWRDNSRRGPQSMRTTRASTGVRSYSGLALGMDLAAVERINGGPFTMTGFHWDYAGTVTSWNGGALERATADSCRLIVRFEPSGQAPRSLQGDRPILSSDPQMRALSPRVYEIVLQYR